MNAVAKLTAKGRPVMEAIGRRQTSFFDGGITEGSGIWGEVLAQETGARPGVLTGLVKQGLLITGEADPNGGVWYALTALGAEVANHLAGQPLEAPEAAVEPTLVESTPEPAPAAEEAPDATYPARGNYNSVWVPLALVLADQGDVRVWAERVSTMLVNVHIAGPKAEPFLHLLEEVIAASQAAMKVWQRDHAEARRSQTDMVRFQQNRAFLAGFGAAVAAQVTGGQGLPEVQFAKDMAHAMAAPLAAEALEAGAAAGKASGIGGAA